MRRATEDRRHWKEIIIIIIIRIIIIIINKLIYNPTELDSHIESFKWWWSTITHDLSKRWRLDLIGFLAQQYYWHIYIDCWSADTVMSYRRSSPQTLPLKLAYLPWRPSIFIHLLLLRITIGFVVVVIRHKAQYSRGWRHHICFCCCDIRHRAL